MKKLLWAMFGVAMLVACQPKGYKVSGTLEGAADGKVYLKSIKDGQPQTIDTADVVGQKFVFEGNAVDDTQMHLIYYADVKMPIAFFLENANISITAQLDKFQEAVITGSPVNELLKKFNDEMPGMERSKEIRNEFMQAQMSQDQEKMKVLGEEMNSIMEKQKAYFETFVKNNTDNVLGAFLAMNMASSMELEELKALIAEFEANLGDHTYVQELKKVIEPLEAQAKAQEATKEGNVAPEFSLNTKDGEAVALSSFRGKYVLVDFWASWCQPCRKENPNVVKAYKAYKSKGFEVFSVSVDQDAAKWENAVKEDGLVWAQVRDAAGDVAKMYAIQSIPTTFLLDKEGKIIAKNLRGAALEAKLAELLN